MGSNIDTRYFSDELFTEPELFEGRGAGTNDSEDNDAVSSTSTSRHEDNSTSVDIGSEKGGSSDNNEEELRRDTLVANEPSSTPKPEDQPGMSSNNNTRTLEAADKNARNSFDENSGDESMASNNLATSPDDATNGSHTAEMRHLEYESRKKGLDGAENHTSSIEEDESGIRKDCGNEDYNLRKVFERKQKKRSDKDRLAFERKQKEREEKERREFERREKERQERERREIERLERDRQERERLEREMRETEHQVFYYSEVFQGKSEIPENCHIALYTEKKEELGEDSMPLIYRNANLSCVGVFDGMGGAGAAEYLTLTIGSKTGAYLSSRIVRAVCMNMLFKYGQIDVIKLKQDISKYFKYLLSIWNVKPSGLRSGFVRVLPTTLAIVEAKIVKHSTMVTSYWAGDSRNYVLLASGLKQLSVDDLRLPKDPLENLRSDDALSNCICFDKPYDINVKSFVFNEPIIILSATDGCFGYLSTPMHFEFILLDSMMKSSNCDEWCESIRQTLSPVSSDDFTIGLQIVTGDFTYWQTQLYRRYEYLRDAIITPLDRMKTAHENAIRECAMCEQRLYAGIEESWSKYKTDYMLLNQSYQK